MKPYFLKFCVETLLMFLQLEKGEIRHVSLRVPSPIAPLMRARKIFTIFYGKSFAW